MSHESPRLRSSSTVSLLLALSLVGSLAACDDDAADGDAGGETIDAGAPDAKPPNFVDCPLLTDAGEPPPVPDPLVISGAIQSNDGTTRPLAGATFELLDTADDHPLATSTSDATGAFTLSLATGGVWPHGYQHVRAPGHVSTHVGGRTGATAGSPDFTITMYPDDVFAEIAGPTHIPGTGTIVLQVVDCVDDGVEGARVRVVGSTADVRIAYAGAPMLPDSGLSATGPTATVFIFNLPPGLQSLNVEYGDFSPYRFSTSVEVVADEVTVAEVRPRS